MQNAEFQKIEGEQQYVESLFIPRNQVPKGAVDGRKVDISEKKVKKSYKYGFNDVYLMHFTDGTVKCENWSNGADWFFQNAQDGFNYAKQISQRSRALNGMLGY